MKPSLWCENALLDKNTSFLLGQLQEGMKIHRERIHKVARSRRWNDDYTSAFEGLIWEANVNIATVAAIVGNARKKRSRQEKKTSDESICGICCKDYDHCDKRRQVIVDCGHMFCSSCIRPVNRCPMCRKKKTKVVTIFL
jgi:hypothetical protein